LYEAVTVAVVWLLTVPACMENWLPVCPAGTVKLEGGGKALVLLEEREMVAPVPVAAPLRVNASVAVPPLLTLAGVMVKPVRVGRMGFCVKVAVGLRLLFIVTTQGLPPLHAPLQAENVQPLAAVAFIVTWVPPE
jgi:hypothetical protein